MSIPRHHIIRRAAIAVALALAFLAVPQWSALAQYRLGPEDRVRLKIYEWRASRDMIFEWTALNDEFTVGADGFMSLPFVGPVRAAGQEPVELSRTIADLLVRSMNLGMAPDVAVEIVQFRPFYITGEVMEPGDFPYRPGLTVLQAVSLAGGLRTRRDHLERVERELIGSRGEVSLLHVNRIGLLARKARLEAEFEGSGEITFPPELVERRSDNVGAILMDQERAILEARRSGLEAQLKALSDLRVFLERESEALKKQLDLLDQQIASLESEIANIGSLVQKGLAIASRQMELERALLELRSDRVAGETALLRAQQDISRTEVSILELQSNRDNEVASELRNVQAELNEIERRMDTALLLVRDSEAYLPMALTEMEARARKPRFVVVRQGISGAEEIEADENTALQPGDTLVVELPLAAMLPEQVMEPHSVDQHDGPNTTRETRLR